MHTHTARHSCTCTNTYAEASFASLFNGLFIDLITVKYHANPGSDTLKYYQRTIATDEICTVLAGTVLPVLLNLIEILTRYVSLKALFDDG